MQRFCALLLTSALAFEGCAARGVPAARQFAVDPPEVWRMYTEKLPIGSTVTVRSRGGDRFTASILVVDAAGVTVKPRSRLVEPARHIAFADLEELEPQRNNGPGVRAGAIGVGIATGIGAFFGSFLVLCLAGHCGG